MGFGHQRTESFRIMLREIAQAGPIPRIDLSARTGISRATVTTITAELLKGGLIYEVQRPPVASSGRGRPRVDLKIAGDAHLVAGIKVGDTSISLVLMDFEGTELTALERPLSAIVNTPDALAREIRQGIADLAQSAGHETRAITGVGVGLAGLIQADEGYVYWSPSLDRRNIPFQEVLQTELNIPVFLDNDVNLVAEAELRFGMGRDRSDFIVVTIEAGVGMGIVLGGQVYRGTRGSGGEFGHTKVQLEGALCRCEQRGCLEAYVADFALHREAVNAGFASTDDPADTAIMQILAAAKNGDKSAIGILEQAGRMFALGLANLVNIFDPELIIIAGAQMRFDHLYEDWVIAEMRKSSVEIDKPAPEVVIHKWGDRMWALGAAARALDFVQDIAIDRLAERDA